MDAMQGDKGLTDESGHSQLSQSAHELAEQRSEA